ncbi:MAG: lactate racemase domain-containing protein [Pirellulales bacterium]
MMTHADIGLSQLVPGLLGMTNVLHYGSGGSVEFLLPPEIALFQCGTAVAEPLDDIPAAMAACLQAPLEYPPLAEAVVPGDRIVIALDHGLPQAAALVAGVVNSLLEARIEPADVSVLITPETAALATFDLSSALDATLASQIEMHVHEPANREQLSYIAASAEAKPIYINRAIAEADVVIPIGCLRIDESVGYHGVHGELFPGFADQETRERFRSPAIEDIQVTRRRRRDEVREAAWKLGAAFTIQVIPGGGDDVLQILAGEVETVIQEGRRQCDAAWRCRLPQRVSLVVAAISGGPASQSWENVGRALASARRVVQDGGAIALLCDLATRPGPAVQRIVAARIDEGEHALAMREIRRQKTPDAAAAAQILLAQDQAKIYLASQLDEDTVYELGFAAVDDPHDLVRLATRHESCLLLSNAQYAVVAADDEAAAP